MGKIAKIVTGMMMVAVLAACGGGYSEDDARKELKSAGFSGDLADCVLDQIKDEAGSIEKFGDLKSGEQQDMAAKAGAECAKSADPDDIKDIAEGSGLDLKDPAARESIITGMTSSGVPEEMANCILDKAIDEDFEAADFTDATKIQALAQACQ